MIRLCQDGNCNICESKNTSIYAWKFGENKVPACKECFLSLDYDLREKLFEVPKESFLKAEKDICDKFGSLEKFTDKILKEVYKNKYEVFILYKDFENMDDIWIDEKWYKQYIMDLIIIFKKGQLFFNCSSVVEKFPKIKVVSKEKFEQLQERRKKAREKSKLLKTNTVKNSHLENLKKKRNIVEKDLLSFPDREDFYLYKTNSTKEEIEDNNPNLAICTWCYTPAFTDDVSTISAGVNLKLCDRCLESLDIRALSKYYGLSENQIVNFLYDVIDIFGSISGFSNKVFDYAFNKHHEDYRVYIDHFSFNSIKKSWITNESFMDILRIILSLDKRFSYVSLDKANNGNHYIMVYKAFDYLSEKLKKEIVEKEKQKNVKITHSYNDYDDDDYEDYYEDEEDEEDDYDPFDFSKHEDCYGEDDEDEDDYDDDWIDDYIYLLMVEEDY